MKILLNLLSIAIILHLSSCAPKVRTHLASDVNYLSLPFDEEVYVFEQEESLPPIKQELGEVKISDSGVSTKCSYEQVIEKAKIEARKVGGNTLVIVKHKLPNMMSSCHRIVAKILSTEIDSTYIANMNVSTIEGADYALLHVYRYGAVGALVNYDLHMGDSTICRIKRNVAETIKIAKEGEITLSASTETKTELSLDIEHGKEYYIRCGLSMGILVGRPSIEKVSIRTGKQEFSKVAKENK